MALESKIGRECKVTIGTDKIVGLGTWTFTGGSYAELDDTEFGDDDEQILRGLRTAGTVTFSGNYKADDVTGQDKIRDAYWMQSDLTTLRFYVDDTSYYTPNSTTAAGGGLPAETMVSHIKILSEPSISVDKNGLATIDFSGKMVGAMRLI
jgi:hypothetical protein